ncbi:hypothetical protein E1211_31280 [Micromonospora sp. 15K316]|uniref:hypothetical protein n=1 Tax=Micromonospora sp. 15K316 TaxID=2530376 RepID=UPI00104A87A8|nr:hypothetical protein [Micromonospora sp. 15K316]TDC25053.1 hypothetical protein E1211_31280 [Micromonospora sp. 15K316]
MKEQGSRRSGAVWVPAWTIAVLVLAAVLRHGTVQGDKSWLVGIGAGLIGALITGIITVITERGRVLVHRVLAALAGGGWMTWVALAGWSPVSVVLLVGWAAVLALLEWVLAPTVTVAQVIRHEQPAAQQPVFQSRSDEEAAWEALLRRLTKAKVIVRGITSWPNPNDGTRIHLDLPEGLTVKKMSESTLADDIAGAVKLPQGCVVRILDAAHQGAAILDVMTRDCLADDRMISEPTTPASINDEFDLATSPRGEAMTVCLRQKGMVVGGTTGSGKTTLLHRIIMFLARCTDALIWVIDFNGGGVASMWLGPYARGEAKKPTIDWVAEDEIEAAAMCAVLIAVTKDRKTNRESMRRKRRANTTVVPVDKDFPAIVILTDEGGEIRQAIGLLASLVDQYIARIAQIGRAEGARVIQSVLRGTSDLLEKGLRAVQGIRICLRMDEEGEYDHVLGKNPGRVRLLHLGSAFLYRTDRDYRPVLVRTVNVDVKSIERHAIATADLRPDLDQRGRLVASRVTAADVLDGRDPRDPKFADLLEHPVFQDVAAGLVYENRWERKAAMLAELRDEDLPEDDEPTAPARPEPTVTPVAAPGSALARLAHGAGVAVDQQQAPAAEDEKTPVTVPAQPTPQQPVPVNDVDAVAAALLSEAHLALDADPARPASPGAELVPLTEPKKETRDLIREALREAYPRMMTAVEIRTAIRETTGNDVTKQRAHELLTKLVGAGEVVRDDTRAGGPFYGLAV